MDGLVYFEKITPTHFQRKVHQRRSDARLSSPQLFEGWHYALLVPRNKHIYRWVVFLWSSKQGVIGFFPSKSICSRCLCRMIQPHTATELSAETSRRAYGRAMIVMVANRKQMSSARASERTVFSRLHIRSGKEKEVHP